MKYRIYFELVLAISLGLLFNCPVMSANGDSSEKKMKVNIVVNDQYDEMLDGVGVFFQDGRNVRHTENGEITLYVKKGEKLVFSKKGYADKVYMVTNDDPLVEISMERLRKSNELSLSSTAVECIASDEIVTPGLTLSESLAGIFSGMHVQQKAGLPGNTGAQMTLRGNKNLAVYVDGVLSAYDEVDPEEIKDIYVLKDVASRAILGPDAVNGAIWITTLHGNASAEILDVSVESGLKNGHIQNDYLNSYDYATLYNEARMNDGMAPLYSTSQLEAYRDHTDLIANPDNDYVSDYMSPFSHYHKAKFRIGGGSENIRYFLYLGYLNDNGLEKIGQRSTYNKINLRANIDTRINKVISARIGVASSLGITNRGSNSGNPVFDIIRNHRPNEYPITYPDFDGNMVYGGSLFYNNNIEGMMSQTGYVKSETRNADVNLGLHFNFDDLTEGLYADVYTAFTHSNYVTLSKSKNFNCYVPELGVNPDTGLETIVPGYRVRTLSALTHQEKGATNVYSKNSVRATIGYDHAFGRHAVNARLYGALNFMELKNGQYKDLNRNANVSLMANYVYDNRFITSLTLSNYFSPAISFKTPSLFPTFDFGYVISKEDALENATWLDLLKLKVSAGMMGGEVFNNYYMDASVWKESGSVGFGDNLVNKFPLYNQTQVAASPLLWEKVVDVNAGISMAAFKNSLSFDLDYFYQMRFDQITRRTSLYPDGAIVPFTNFGKMSRQGVDFALNYRNKSGDFTYGASLNGIYTISKNIEVDDPYAGTERARAGRPVDAIYGYKALGLFQDQAEIDNAPAQLIGSYHPGDVRYEDINSDDVVNLDDITMIGNTYPRFTYGLDLSFGYRNFGFSALFTGAAGYDIVLDSDFYQVYGSRKYSSVVNNRWTEESKATATYPRLSTFKSENNFKKSTFWTVAGDYFKMKNLEVYYKLDDSITDRWKISDFKIFFKAMNVFTISALDGADPEDFNAGYSGYPTFRTFSLGLSVNF